MPDVQILEWLKARARLIEAEEQLLKAKVRLIDAEEQHSSILDNAERWGEFAESATIDSFGQKGWPDGLTVGVALQECREAERAFDEADAALNLADRRMLKSIPDL
jgi:hypothetical protein